MDIKFYESEIKELLIEKAKSFGIKASDVDFEVKYGSVYSATVYYAEPLEPEVNHCESEKSCSTPS